MLEYSSWTQSIYCYHYIIPIFSAHR